MGRRGSGGDASTNSEPATPRRFPATRSANQRRRAPLRIPNRDAAPLSSDPSAIQRRGAPLRIPNPQSSAAPQRPLRESAEPRASTHSGPLAPRRYSATRSVGLRSNPPQLFPRPKHLACVNTANFTIHSGGPRPQRTAGQIHRVDRSTGVEPKTQGVRQQTETVAPPRRQGISQTKRDSSAVGPPGAAPPTSQALHLA